MIIDTTYPISSFKIREDRTIVIGNLPANLTKAEADQIIKIIMAHVTESTNEASIGDHSGGGE